MRDVRALMTAGQAVTIPRPGVDLIDEAAAEPAPYHDPLDPPIFLLQAAPTFAGGNLPDGVWQRVPIGAAAQVLTVQSDGSVAWANNPAGFTNPMVNLGDMIQGGISGVPTDLPIGTAGQVLTVVSGVPAWANAASGFSNPMTGTGDMISATTGGVPVRVPAGTSNQVLTMQVSGLPAWANASSGFSNPMTTAGDLIFENATPAPARLAIGTAGQVLTVVGGLPVWQNAASGFSNPMTTAGDLITGATGGAAQRLGIGANGQVLGVSAGVPTWITNPAGFANPMTAKGDLITAATGGTAQRLGIGAFGQVLTASSTGTAIWQTTGGIVVPPSGDNTGVTDTANITAAIAALPNGGTITLTAGNYWILEATNGTPAISLPWYMILRGQRWGTTVNYLGNNSCVLAQDPAGSVPPLNARHNISGAIDGIAFDGTSAGANAVLVDIRDIEYGYYADVQCRNATGANAVGFQLANQNTSCNGIRGCVSTNNCQTGIQFTSFGSQHAIEHVNMTWHINLGAGQNGINVTGSVGVQGSQLNVDIGSSTSNAGTGIVMGPSTAFQTCLFCYKHEMASAPGTSTSIAFGAASAQFTQCMGIMFFGSNLQPATGITTPNQNDQFDFFGIVKGDSVLTAAASRPTNAGYSATTIATPAIGTGTTNNANNKDVWVTLSGPGTITAATQINGVAIGDTNTRIFFLPSNGSITLAFTGTINWQWQPV